MFALALVPVTGAEFNYKWECVRAKCARQQCDAEINCKQVCVRSVLSLVISVVVTIVAVAVVVVTVVVVVAAEEFMLAKSLEDMATWAEGDIRKLGWTCPFQFCGKSLCFLAHGPWTIWSGTWAVDNMGRHDAAWHMGRGRYGKYLMLPGTWAVDE